MRRAFVRAFAPADIDVIIDIEARAFGAASWGEKSLREGLQAPLVDVFVVGSNPYTDIEGFALWRTLGAQGEILSFAVAPEARRRGLAGALLDAIVATAGERGVNELFLEVAARNEPALALYRSRGFSVVSVRTRYYRDGADALVLKKPLTTE